MWAMADASEIVMDLDRVEERRTLGKLAMQRSHFAVQQCQRGSLILSVHTLLLQLQLLRQSHLELPQGNRRTSLHLTYTTLPGMWTMADASEIVMDLDRVEERRSVGRLAMQRSRLAVQQCHLGSLILSVHTLLLRHLRQSHQELPQGNRRTSLQLHKIRDGIMQILLVRMMGRDLAGVTSTIYRAHAVPAISAGIIITAWASKTTVAERGTLTGAEENV